MIRFRNNALGGLGAVRRGLLISLGVMLWLGILASGPETFGKDAVGPTPVTVDDVLKIEGLGSAAFSPDGRWLAYNLIPPYDELSDYSYYLHAARLSGHQVWIKDTLRNAGSRLQPGLDPSATNYLWEFSPDGRHIVVLEYLRGRLRIVSCKVGRDRCVRLSRMPDIRDMYISPAPWNERLVWTSSETFLMPTRSDDQPGSELRSRGAAGRFLWEKWNEAWAGGGPTATEVISTQRDRSLEWASGILVEFNIRTGAERVIAEGRFAGVRASPDGKKIIAARVGERAMPPPDVGLVPTETHPIFDRRYAPRIIDVQTGLVGAPATPFNVDPHPLVWSQDGNKYAVYGWTMGRGVEQGGFYLFETGSLRGQLLSSTGVEIALNGMDEVIPWVRGPERALLLDRGLVVRGRLEGAAETDWLIIEEAERVSALSHGLDSVGGPPLFAKDEFVYIRASQGIFRLDAVSASVTPLLTAHTRLNHIASEAGGDHGWSTGFRFHTEEARDSLDASDVFIARDSEGATSVIFLDYTDEASNPVGLETHIRGAKVLAASATAGAALVSAKDGAATRLLLLRAGAEPEELVRINEHLNDVSHPATRTIRYHLNDTEGQGAPRSRRRLSDAAARL